MATRRGMSAEIATALTSTYAVLTLDDDTTADASAEVVPDVCWLSWVSGEIDTIASSAATITWYLAADSDGDIPLTAAVTETILVGKTTATDGGVSTKLDTVHVRFSSGTAGKLYLVAKTDTGTCKLKARLMWEARE